MDWGKIRKGSDRIADFWAGFGPGTFGIRSRGEKHSTIRSQSFIQFEDFRCKRSPLVPTVSDGCVSSVLCSSRFTCKLRDSGTRRIWGKMGSDQLLWRENPYVHWLWRKWPTEAEQNKTKRHVGSTSNTEWSDDYVNCSLWRLVKRARWVGIACCYCSTIIDA